MSRILEPVQQLTSEFFIKQLRCNWNFTVHNGALLLVLLFFLQFSFLLWTKLGLFLFFPFAFVFASLITHIFFSVIENDCSCTSRESQPPLQASVSGTCPAYSRNAIFTRPVRRSSDSGHRRAVVQPPQFQCVRISEIPESQKVLGGPKAPQDPLPRGWKRRVRSSVLHILALSHYTYTALLARAAHSMQERYDRKRASRHYEGNPVYENADAQKLRDAREAEAQMLRILRLLR